MKTVKNGQTFKLKTGKVPSETQEQIWFVNYLRKFHPDIFFFHVPNQGARTPKSGAILKMMGFMKGFPDLCILHPAKNYLGCFIEMKRIIDSIPNCDQLRVMNELEKIGYKCYVAFGAYHAVDCFKEYLLV